jgi:uncharacterized protein YndB with AHSA1/START domain
VDPTPCGTRSAASPSRKGVSHATGYAKHRPLEKQVGLDAPRARVWRALTDPRDFGLRWHPYAIEPRVDYSGEPTTLVMFTLEDAGSGTMLTVVESGFDKIPAARRAKAFEMNSMGWGMQMENIAKHLAG